MRLFFLMLALFIAAPTHAITKQAMIDNILEMGKEVVQDGSTIEFNYRGIDIVQVFGGVSLELKF